MQAGFGGRAAADRLPPRERLGTEFGISAFERHCTACHGNPNVERAPSPAAIRQMPPERIYAALTTGVMKVNAEGMSDEELRRLAEYMGGRPPGGAAFGDAARSEATEGWPKAETPLGKPKAHLSFNRGI